MLILNMLNKLIIILLIALPYAHDDHNHDHGRGHGHGAGSIAHHGVVSGKILNNETKDPIEYSSISIFSIDDEKLIAGAISDENGYFIIDNIPSGNFKVVIEFIGYEQHLQDFTISKDPEDKTDLGVISLTPKAIDTKEVNITGEMPTIEFETDKLVYTPSKDILSSSGSAEDVLNNVPMVLVDQDGAISLKGSSNVKILVNGRENRIGEGGNDVDNIPASMIEKVEVITSPSAKYDPEGMAGIINIILKKDEDRGFNGEVKVYSKFNEHHKPGEMGGLSISGNYKTSKLNLYSSYSNSIRYRDREGSREAYTTYTNPEVDPLIPPSEVVATDSIYFTSISNNKKKSQVLRLGTDYYLNEDVTLNLETRYNTYSASEQSTETTILPEEEEKTHEDAEPDGNYEIGVSFSADKRYDNPDQELSFFYSYDTHPVDTEFDIIIEDGHQDTTFINSKLASQEAKLFYSHPVGESSKFEMGYDFDQTNNNEEMDYFLHIHESELIPPEPGDPTHISGKNIYNYKRDIHGAFIEYSRELTDKWSIKPGVRFEYVDKNINFTGTPDHWYCLIQDGYQEFDSYSDCDASSICASECLLSPIESNEIGAYSQILQANNNTDLDDDYTSIYPSFHVTYNITEKKSLQFAISSRVERPGGGHHGGSRQIRPFPREIHAEHFIFLGNPELQPEYSTNYELSYKSPISIGKPLTPVGFFYTNLYFNDVRDKIEWYSSNEYPNFDVLTFKNADKAKSYGLEWFCMIMGQTLGGGFWYNDVQDGSDDTELNGINKGLNMYGKINLPEKNIKFFGLIFCFYFMKMQDEYGSMFGNK